MFYVTYCIAADKALLMRQEWKVMDEAERIVEQSPDSSLANTISWTIVQLSVRNVSSRRGIQVLVMMKYRCVCLFALDCLMRIWQISIVSPLIPWNANYTVSRKRWALQTRTNPWGTWFWDYSEVDWFKCDVKCIIWFWFCFITSNNLPAIKAI